MTPENTPKKLNESGHSKNAESFQRLYLFGETLDQARLDPPDDLTVAALQAMHSEALVRQAAIGNSKADFRTAALERSVEVDKFEPLAAQVLAQLAARGASRETVEDGRSYVRKLQGASKKPKVSSDPASPNFDPTAKNISSSQQSNAAKIATFLEFVDFIEAQGIYAEVKQPGLLVADLRALGQSAQAKHTNSIEKSSVLAADRNERNKFYYLDADNLCDRAARYKNLVKGAYGAKSVEYKTINAIPFKKYK